MTGREIYAKGGNFDAPLLLIFHFCIIHFILIFFYRPVEIGEIIHVIIKVFSAKKKRINSRAKQSQDFFNSQFILIINQFIAVAINHQQLPYSPSMPSISSSS